MAIVVYTTIFAVLSPPDNPLIEPAIGATFPQDHLQIRPGEWLIAGSGTAKEISDKLGVTDGRAGTAIILATSGYYGRASNQIWEWIAAKLGGTRSG